MEQTLRWGILGTGNIAGQFARGLRMSPGNALHAVGSRSIDTARRFGREFDITRCHGSYAALAEDAEIDVVYVATPHSLHCDNMLMCLEAGKHVLCEKPLALNVQQATQAIQCTKQKNLFLMEAMWTRFLPPIVEVHRMVAQGAVGDVRIVAADLGFNLPFGAVDRVFNPALGGGCLMDAGVYPISLATMFLGSPAGITGMATFGPTAVDEENVLSLSYAGGQLASLVASIRVQTPQQASIIGSAGMLLMHAHWWRGGPFSIRIGQTTKEFDIPFASPGYQYEADEVRRCLLSGQTESKTMPVSESLIMLQITDELRKQWKLKYPTE